MERRWKSFGRLMGTLSWSASLRRRTVTRTRTCCVDVHDGGRPAAELEHFSRCEPAVRFPVHGQRLPGGYGGGDLCRRGWVAHGLAAADVRGAHACHARLPG